MSKMLNSLTQPRRRMLAISILFGVILLVIMLIVEPYVMAYRHSVEHLDLIVFKVKQDKKVIQKQSFYHDEIERLGLVRGQRNIYLRSDRVALASAEIQQILKSAAKKAGAELTSSRPFGSGQEELGRVGVEVRVKSDIFGLRKFLYALEAGTPMLIIEEVTINRGGRAVFRFRDRESTNQTLDIQMQIYGYIKKHKDDK